VRRNKVTFVSGTIALLGLLAALGVATRLYVREREVSEEQGRLRANAESLQQAAERRGLVSQAALSISYGNVPEADRLLAQVPLAETPSSLEAANCYRVVADWHFASGRTAEAAERYSSLARAIAGIDPSDNDSISRNLLPAAAALCFTGNVGEYERIRALALERFSNTTHPIVAEQVLKTCLLLPANEEILGKLRPLEVIVEAAVDDMGKVLGGNEHLAGWSCFAMALARYRNGDDAAATAWANRGIAIRLDNPARLASMHIVLAMVEQRGGRTGNARAFFLQAAGPVMEKTSAENVAQAGNDQGFWYDWVNARILLREATAMLGE